MGENGGINPGEKPALPPAAARSGKASHRCPELGLSGLEFAHGIPGTWEDRYECGAYGGEMYHVKTHIFGRVSAC